MDGRKIWIIDETLQLEYESEVKNGGDAQFSFAILYIPRFSGFINFKNEMQNIRILNWKLKIEEYVLNLKVCGVFSSPQKEVLLNTPRWRVRRHKVPKKIQNLITNVFLLTFLSMIKTMCKKKCFCSLVYKLQL